MADSISPKALAMRCGTNPKALRRFIRALAASEIRAGKDARIAPVGQGNRYDLSAADARYIETLWRKAHGMPALPAPKASKGKPKAQRIAASDEHIAADEQS